MRQSLLNLYTWITLKRPWAGIVLTLAILALAAWSARDFRLDASADSLVLEHDEDLNYFRQISRDYETEDFLIVTYTPQADLFADSTIQAVGELRDELAAIDGISSTLTYLDVPLVRSPPMNLAEISDGIRTLTSPGTDRELARQEFATSPIYKSLLTDPAGTTTALLLYLKGDPAGATLLRRREDLRELRRAGELTPPQAAELERVEADYERHKQAQQADTTRLIADVREVLARHRNGTEIFLGGVPMIASDMIDFVKSDLKVFGIGVSILLLALLGIAFRRLRWILIPAVTCSAAAVVTAGFIGWMDWPVTVVSSNFVALVLVITLSLVVHLIVQHAELHAEHPEAQPNWLISETVHAKINPSLFTALTTMVSFASFAASGIRPVIDFGMMMVYGVAFAFLITFLMFPSLLAKRAPGTPIFGSNDVTAHLTQALATLNRRHGTAVLVTFALAIAAGAYGISQLVVENRFIDYFKDDTEIYQGMLKIDQKLGGTTPLDIILDAPESFYDEQANVEDDPFADEFDDFGGGETGISGSSYWFNIFELETVEEIHDYLDSLPETGKVLSMASTMDLLEQINGGELDNFSLAVMHGRLPDSIKTTLFDPYMSDDGNQMHISLRVIDSDKNLSRNDLLEQIEHDLNNNFGLQPDQVHLTGLLVLYNNVLQSLFRSQIVTLGLVFAAILVMLSFVFRSVFVAFLGLMPTMAAAALILGTIGLIGIPLDIMTITIAAITIGIGVDDTIHYTDRFRIELARDGDYLGAMNRSHASVGRAMYYTSVTITLGFSIMALSNFMPTIYFGLLAGLAMVLALIANLTLLPILYIKLRPFPATTLAPAATAEA